MTNLRSHRILGTFVAALALLLSSMGPPAAAAAPGAATHTVAIDGMQFLPGALTVKAGDSIVWVNKDPFPHTVRSRRGGFDSGEIAPGQSWKFTPRKKGELAYTCSLHPTMTAVLRVK